MKKKPAVAVSRPEEPHDIVFTPDPLVLRLSLPRVFIHTFFHGDLAHLRKLAPQDLKGAQRLAEAIEQYREIVPKEWRRWGKEFVLRGEGKKSNSASDSTNGLAEGNPQPFLCFVKEYGPRGLGLMLADEEILRHVEDWWVKSILGDSKAFRKSLIRIGEELARAGSRGSKKKNLPEESIRKEKASNLQITHGRRALHYYDRALSTYAKETRGIKDISTLREIAHKIARRELGRGGQAKQEGIRLFTEQVKQDLAGRTVRVNSHTFPT